ncbi:3-hydroxyisobutyrate dehydrogenase, mitochondrial [Eurytemora carolleeae]|uniref:3-hydroxyisobutyrate dehydrogenase, mitochondrial n=1 Tax=Eurytemora carolleeae TaxID=1294199 RepID=UPI000C75C687|nr:3-hydroxyisobutyrate dehydrogenase, mitochondrial [Eurytemora carolleeae]|eukprot:XP_023325846.1 3-hydroxyisobutyrate dehydrogenase, mitochondrial-like [Eurytemora affinis]
MLNMNYILHNRSLCKGIRLISTSQSVYSATAQRIGVIGMGHVGTAVTKNLLRNGFNVSAIMDVKPDLCQGYPDTVKVVGSPAEVAQLSDVVVSGLPKPHHVKEVFEGSSGLLAGLKQGQIWIDHSTTDHEQNKVFTEQMAAKGAYLLECPITGGLDALKKGQMAVWVAGDKEKYVEVKPILDASYSTVQYTGGLGTAMIPKVLSNMLCGLQVIAMAEAMLIAKRHGLDLVEFWHSIRMSAGNSFLWETCGPNVFRGEYHDSFPIELMCKDNQLGYEMARNAKIPLELFGLMQQIYNRALYSLGPDVGCYAPPILYEREHKESLQAPGFENWTYSVENVDGALHVRHEGIELPAKKQKKE